MTADEFWTNLRIRTEQLLADLKAAEDDADELILQQTRHEIGLNR